MEIGQKVMSDLYEEYGEGTIISKSQIFSEEYFKVFFESAGKTVEIQKEDLKPLETPLDLFKAALFSSSSAFKLNFLSHYLEALSSDEKALSPVNFKIKPLPHQLLALNFVIDQFRPRCLLADEVGLGKTIEAALIMEELKLRNIVKRVLIVTPAGLTQQWQDELKLKFGEDFSIFNGESFKSFKQLYGQESNCWLKFDSVITSLDFLKPKKIHDDLSPNEIERRKEHNKQVFDDCLNAQWDMVLIDEAHKLTKYQGGKETARYKVGKMLSESVPIFLILTATPHQGKQYVFKNLLQLVDPYTFNRIEDVTPKNVSKITVKNQKRASIDFNGNKLFKERIPSLKKIKWESDIDDPEKELYQAVEEYISEYYDYAQQEKNRILIFLLMLYQRIVSSSSRAILKSLERRLATLNSLRSQAKVLKEYSLDDFFDLPGEAQIADLEKIVPILNNPHLVKKEIRIVSHCIELAKNAIMGRNDAKLRSLMEIIDEVKRRENDKDVKILIFTEFVETQNYIIESLENLGYKTAFINGSLSLDEKINQKMRFMDDAQIMVSTDAGGEGINLQFCHVVINYDIPWNPMKLEQRIGRVDRIGQDKDVIVINFVLSDTIEEYVRMVIESKLELIKEQFGDDKLNDILSTLDEEFSFDKIYIKYLVGGKKDDEQLQEISDEIYDKAKEILEKDDVLVPFSDQSLLQKFDIEDINRITRKIKSFTNLFLESHGMELTEYKDNEGLYYFRNDFRTEKLPNYYSKIIFEQSRSLNIEDADLFSLKHPFINEALLNSRITGQISSFRIDDTKFSGKRGLLFNWFFTVSNNFNVNRRYVIPIFIEDTGRFNRRISEYLIKLDEFDLIDEKINYDVNAELLHDTALKSANEMAESIFWELERELNEKIQEDQEKIRKYYYQKAKAIEQIKIENIRIGKQKELKKEKTERMIELKKQSRLFPEMECFQICIIQFN
jgi:SNF2 family DNA or RNA helicase